MDTQTFMIVKTAVASHIDEMEKAAAKASTEQEKGVRFSFGGGAREKARRLKYKYQKKAYREAMKAGKPQHKPGFAYGLGAGLPAAWGAGIGATSLGGTKTKALRALLGLGLGGGAGAGATALGRKIGKYQREHAERKLEGMGKSRKMLKKYLMG
jgi:hypothetical protein